MNNVKLFQAHKGKYPQSVSLEDTTQLSDDHLSFNISLNFQNVHSTFSHYYTQSHICYNVYHHEKVSPTLIVRYTLHFFLTWQKHFNLV